MRSDTEDVPVDPQQVDRILEVIQVRPVALQEQHPLGMHIKFIGVRREIITLLQIEIGARNDRLAGLAKLVERFAYALQEVMNLSVNETLSRTVMTSGTTLLALIALLILGGDVIRGFVFAMIWGVIVGTYSSVFVAKNVVLMLGVKFVSHLNLVVCLLP